MEKHSSQGAQPCSWLRHLSGLGNPGEPKEESNPFVKTLITQSPHRKQVKANALRGELQRPW